MKKYLIFSIILLAIVSFGIASKANASGTTNLTGWGWSSNIGWISFSSANVGQSTGGTYNVTLSTTTGSDIGNFGGWAWSSNVGWISFENGDGAHPNPTVNLTSGLVSGWARACAGTVNHDCTGADRTDGWDGWIELAGSGHASGNTKNGMEGITFIPATGVFNGYAWGDVNVGWLTFGSQYPGGTDPVHCTPGVDCPGPVTPGTLGGSCDGTAGAGFATWTVYPTGGTNYTYSWNGAASTTNTLQINGTGTITGPTVVVASSDGKVRSYSCSNVLVAGGTPASGKMWVNNDPARAKSLLKIRIGQTAKINWLLNEYINQGLTSCIGISDKNIPVWKNQAITNTNHDNGDPATSQSSITNLPKNIYTLSIKCTDPDNILNHQETNSIQIIVSDSKIEEI